MLAGATRKMKSEKLSQACGTRARLQLTRASSAWKTSHLAKESRHSSVAMNMMPHALTHG